MAERRGGERDRKMQPSAAAAALEEQTVEGALDEIEAALMPMLEMDQTELMDEMDSRHRASIFIDIAAATAIASFVSLTSQLEALQLHSTDDNDTTTTTTTTTHEDVNVRLAHVHQQLRVAQADLARVARCKRELTMMMALRQRQKANKAKVRDAGREDGTEKTKKKKRKLGNESDPDQTLETRTTTTDTTRQKKDFDLTAAKRFIRSALQATLGPLRRKKSQDARKKVKPQAMDGAVKEEGGTVQKKRKKE